MMNLLIAVMAGTHAKVSDIVDQTNYAELNTIIIELETYMKNFLDESKYKTAEASTSGDANKSQIPS